MTYTLNISIYGCPTLQSVFMYIKIIHKIYNLPSLLPASRHLCRNHILNISINKIIFLKNRTITELGEKLPPVFQHGFLRSEENANLNNFVHLEVYQ